MPHGRPLLEAIHVVPSSIALERPASLSPLEGQNVLKKGRNQPDEGVLESVIAMDADGVSIPGKGVGKTHGHVNHADNSVLESATEPENRRRRVLPESRSILGKNRGEGLVAGSRYKVLEDTDAVEGVSTAVVRVAEPPLVPAKALAVMSVTQKTVMAQQVVHNNDAYLESNPPKKSSKKGVSTSGAVVVPSIAGLDAVIEEHDPKVVRGVHKAEKIVKDRFGGPGASHGVGAKVCMVIGKSLKENI
ncbi:hypothetical protein V6N13_109191 [Hibiscus sabdariffa]|uniref:Uncharacterized protein n=1 Tax=Hibiscus sabdariffa TaxID=183260 RepID=A0ABR2FNV5_9ROSI